MDEEWRTQRLRSSSESGHPDVSSSHTIAGPQLGHVCSQGEIDIIFLMGESELTCDLTWKNADVAILSTCVNWTVHMVQMHRCGM